MKTFGYLTITSCILCLSLAGCAGNYTEYAKAKKSENLAIQLQAEKEENKREAVQKEHEKKVLAMTEKLMTAVAATPDPTDNVVAPLLILVLEDKWAQSKENSARNVKVATTSPIEPPETLGETIQKSGAVILGAGGIFLGIRQSDNLADVAKVGIGSAGTKYTASEGSVINTGKIEESQISGAKTESTIAVDDSYNSTSSERNTSN